MLTRLNCCASGDRCSGCQPARLFHSRAESIFRGKRG